MVRIKYDSHVHSNYSEHPSVDKTSPWLNMEKAVELGLERLYFTEHVDYNRVGMANYNPNVDLPRYYNNLKEMEEAYRGKVRPMFGIEVGLADGFIEPTKEYLKGWEFEQVLASVHFMAPWDPNFHQMEPWYSHSKGDVQQMYLTTMLRLIKEFTDFDVVTHLTFFSRNCPFADNEIRYIDAPDHFDVLFRYLIENGKGTEVNTSSYRKFGFFMPGIEILKRYREMGGEVLTIGSDGHGKDKIGLDLDLAGELAKEAGFRYYTIFEGRKPQFIKL
ncbi:MAG: histidinol-phosphatase HisJ family protein [Clostridiales bacterium]|nr:histidinol-phosphatase HisJ family protein [Clostridiales bacterium]